MEVKIVCPKCNYEPSKHDKWFCSKCFSDTWNTFDTQGLCPECGYQWKNTQCPSCGRWSPHFDWYRFDDLFSEINRILNTQKQKRIRSNSCFE